MIENRQRDHGPQEDRRKDGKFLPSSKTAKKAIQAGAFQLREQEGESPWDDDEGEPAEIQQARP